MTEDTSLSAGRIVLAVGDIAARATGLAQVAGGFEGVRAMTVGLDDAVDAMAGSGAPLAVLIQAAEIASARLAKLGALVEACKADRVPVIVTLTEPQLDEVGGMLIGDSTVLLCEADDAEIAGALAVALADAGFTVRDSSAEAARRQRIQDEVARFAATLTQIVDRTDVNGGSGAIDPYVAERSRGFAGEDVAVDPAELRRAIRARRMRDDVFAMPGLFEDPAWDMLLDLFAAELERRQVSVSSLCIAAAVAPTTALRWIGKLIDAGLLERQPDAFDRRRAFISLHARASKAMRDYLAALRRVGLAVV